MLQDVTLEHLDGGRSKISYLDTVATVQPCAHRAALLMEYENAQAREIDATTPTTYRAAKSARVEAERRFRGCDAWTYTTPRGQTYSHPTQSGALHLARKWFVENGVILVPFDHCHMDATDRGIAADLTDARAKIDGPRVGDFVRLAGDAHTVKRICGIGFDGLTFGLTFGGSFSLSSTPKTSGGGSGYSGSLDWNPAWILSGLVDAGETVKGRFWFFSHGVAQASGGVDVALDCRVYTLDGEPGL